MRAVVLTGVGGVEVQDRPDPQPAPLHVVVHVDVASLRRTMVSTLPMHTEELLAREVDITTLGRRTVAEWLPIIVGHVVHHRDQLHDVLRSRGRLPARFDTASGGDGAA